MQLIAMALFALLVVAADQITKYITVINIAPSNTDAENLAILKEAYHLTDSQIANLPSCKEAIPGLFNFSHVHNEGAAFSALQGMRWLFVGIFLVLTVLLLWEYFKSPLPFTTFERWCIAAIYGGGLGNVIDRVRLGYVVDMIETQFIEFPIFNVADCFITCGCILLIVHIIFFNKAFWKEEKK